MRESKVDRFRCWVEDTRYTIRRNGWRCFLRLHHPGLWADYSGWDYEPPEPYWHCEVCGVDCYPLRWRIEERFWETRLGDRILARQIDKEIEREERERANDER